MSAESATKEWSVVARHQAAIAELGQRGLEGVPLDLMLEEAARIVAEQLHVESVVLLELLPSWRQLRVRAALHKGTWVARRHLEGVRVPAGRSSQAGYTLMVGAPVVATDVSTEKRFTATATGQGLGARSGVTAMIGWEDRPWGVLGAHASVVKEYSEDDVDFLRSVGNVLGLAIQRRRMEDELRESSARLDLSLAAGGLGTWEWDITADLLTLSGSLEQLLGMEVGDFTRRPAGEFMELVHDDDRERVGQLFASAAEERRDLHATFRVACNDGGTLWAESRGRMVVGPDRDEARMVGITADVTERRLADETKASLLERERQARLQAEQARERLSFLATASASLASSLDPEVIYGNLTSLVVPRLGDVCVIDTFDDDGLLAEASVAHARADQLDLMHRVRRRRAEAGGDGIWSVRRVVRTARSELLGNITDDDLQAAAVDEAHLALLQALAPRSVIVVPLIARSRVIGGLTVLRVGNGRRFDEDDLTLAEDLAGRAAMAVDNARLFESRSLVARALQATLLPPALPELPGMEVAARYRVAEGDIEIGGDFYDVFEVSDGRWALVIGDVCGRGPEAAALTGLMRHSVRAAAVRDDRPSRVLGQTNDAILDQIDDTQFCTAAFVRVVPPEVDGGSAQLCISCGGHPRPIVVRADGSVERVDAAGTLLGVLPSPPLVDAALELESGSALVLYTDGVTEARRGTDQFGEARLMTLLEGTQHLDAAALAAHIEAGVSRFQDDSNDDLAIMVLRVKPA